MRKLHTALLLLLALSASAADPETGYYRVQNRTTTRYVYVRDNKGRIDVGATTADYNSIWLIKDDERPHYDPSGIIHIVHKESNAYDLEAQGTSVYNLIEMLPHIYRPNNDYYKIGGTSNGTTKYLSDGESNIYIEQSFPSDANSSEAAILRQRWDIFPVADSYFGIRPAIEAGGRRYATFYADFPYAATAAGMKFYAVVRVGYGQAAISEVSGTVGNATPLLVELAGATAADNTLSIGGTPTATVPEGNMLVGVYFKNTSSAAHRNVVAYDPATMRVLGVTSDGKPGFITATGLSYVDANTAYLSVPEGTDAELRLVAESEFTIPDPDPDPDPDPSGINSVNADGSGVTVTVDGLAVTVVSPTAVAIYNIAGRTVATLPAGGGTATIPAHGIYLLRTAAAAVHKLIL